jgi:hypothetical protein
VAADWGTNVGLEETIEVAGATVPTENVQDICAIAITIKMLTNHCFLIIRGLLFDGS